MHFNINRNQFSDVLLPPPGSKLCWRRAVIDTAPQGERGVTSYDRESRTFTATIATETPSLVFDWQTGRIVREVLIARGGTIPDPVQARKDHGRLTTDVIGSVRSPQRVATEWMATFHLGRTQAALEIGQAIDDGHLDSVSIGYKVGEFTMIEPGRSEVVDGRRFSSDDDYWLRISTKWEVYEVSVVTEGADATAKIRGHNQPLQMRGLAMSAIHSRNTLSDRPSCRQLVYGFTRKLGIEPRGFAPQEAEGGYHLADRSMLDLLRFAAELDGHRFSDTSAASVVGTLHRIAQDAAIGLRRSASTLNLEALLLTTVNNVVQARIDAAGDSTAGWCEEVEQTITRGQSTAVVSAASGLQAVPRGKPADEIEFDTTSEEVSLTRYGGSLTVDEQDLLDDTADAIMQKGSSLLGDGAADVRPRLVYELMDANPDLSDGVAWFHASHGNLKTSAALSDTTIDAAMAALAQQTSNGQKLNQRARFLIVPTTLEHTARKLIRQMELLQNGQQPAPTLRVDSRLDDYSTTTWFVASGQHGPEVRFLKGMNKRPSVRMSFLQGGKFGVNFDLEHWLAVQAVTALGVVRNEA